MLLLSSLILEAEFALNSNDLSFCDAEGKTPLNCRFKIDGHGSREIPNPQHKKLVMSLAFNAPVACGSTKAEITVNNPAFCDNADVSVVDGFNERIQIDVDGRPMGQVVKLGPPLGKLGNQQVFGVFPFACTICAGIVNPPCGSAGPEDVTPERRPSESRLPVSDRTTEWPIGHTAVSENWSAREIISWPAANDRPGRPGLRAFRSCRCARGRLGRLSVRRSLVSSVC